MKFIYPTPITETAFVESSAGALISSPVSETTYAFWVPFARYEVAQRRLFSGDSIVYEAIRRHKRRTTTPNLDTRYWKPAADGTTLTEWNPVTAYSLNQRVDYNVTHRIYKRKVAGTTGTAPNLDTDNWLDVGPNNKWAMFDQSVSSVTAATSPLTVTIQPGVVTALACLEIDGATSVRVQVIDSLEGTVYDATTAVGDTQTINDWWEYCFLEIIPRSDFVLTDLPPYGTAQITITVTGLDKVAIGACVVGNVVDLAPSQYGATVGIIDYSRKETDEFGITDVVERTYAKKLDIDMMIDNDRLDYIARTFANVRATPVVWFEDAVDWQTFILYGFYKDWTINVQYLDNSLATVSIEGLS